MDQEQLQSLRKEYRTRELSENAISSDPLLVFNIWLDEATGAGVQEPNAMTLATAGAEGRPSARIVLLKGISSQGFIFYTNYNSRKGHELATNQFGALIFFWPELERQVRVEGAVAKISSGDSAAYFQKRPRASQIGAIISPQSEPIPNRKFLEDRWRAFETNVGDSPILKPEGWGGYELVPTLIEFWQGRPGRLHDRLAYSRIENKAWSLSRLAP